MRLTTTDPNIVITIALSVYLKCLVHSPSMAGRMVVMRVRLAVVIALVPRRDERRPDGAAQRVQPLQRTHLRLGIVGCNRQSARLARCPPHVSLSLTHPAAWWMAAWRRQSDPVRRRPPAGRPACPSGSRRRARRAGRTSCTWIRIDWNTKWSVRPPGSITAGVAHHPVV